MMRVLLRYLEGALLVTMGGAMECLALGPDYWMLLNPKYEWLTLIAACTCIFFGLAILFGGGSKPRRGRVLAGLVFVCCLALFWWGGEPVGSGQVFDTPMDPPASFSGGSEGTGPLLEQESRITHDGREYVLMNTAELITLGMQPETAPGEGFVSVRGFIVNTPELTEQGMYALFRVQIICCLADAVAVGVLVQGPAPAGDYGWAQVSGSVAETGEMAATLGDFLRGISLPDVMLTYVEPGIVLESQHAEPIEPPSFPYIFEVRYEEPFAF